MVGLWYFYFAGYNRRKGMKALRWVETACVTRARILEAESIGTSKLQARLRFADRWFDNANLTDPPAASPAAGPLAGELLPKAERNSHL